MRKVGGLSKLHDEYFDLGFRVVAISNEPKDKLEEELLDLRKATYWIASDPRDKTQGRFSRGDASGVPMFYLIDAKGRVVGHGVPSEERIVELLGESFELDREMPKELAAAECAYRDGAYGDAWRRAVKVTQSKDASVKAEATYLAERAVGYADFVKKTMPRWLEDKRPEQVYGRILLLSCQFEGMELATWAKQQLKSLSKNDAVKREKKAWRQLHKAIERDLGSLGKSYDRERARQMYETVIERYGHGRAADMAKQRLARFAEVK